MKAALDYLRLQWSVVPLAKDGGLPLIGKQEFAYRIPTTGEIGQWFQRWPDANLGIVTGGVSGLVVLQVCPGSGGEAGLARLQHQHGELAETVLALRADGEQYFFFMHEGSVIPDTGTLAGGVELHADGGYVIAAPSICPAGGPLRWERSPHVYPLAHLPAPWQTYAAALRSSEGNQAGDTDKPFANIELVAEERHEELARLAEHLCSRHVESGIVLQLLQSWNTTRCRPPLDTGEVADIVARAAAGNCQ